MRVLVVLALQLMLAPAVSAHPPERPLAESQPEAFCIVVIEPLDDFRQVRITVDEDLSAPAKAAAWRQANINNDTVVSPQEAEGFRYSTIKFWPGGLELGNKSLALEPGAPYTQATPIRPVYAATWRHPGHGFYEDAVSTHTGLSKDAPVTFDQFETQAVREYGFQVTGDMSRFNLRGADPTFAGNLSVDSKVYVSRPIVEYVIIKAPPGWVVNSATGWGYNGSFTRNENTDRMEIRGFDTSLPWTISFLNPDAEIRLHDTGSPGLGPLFLLLACLLPLAWLRRRGRTPSA